MLPVLFLKLENEKIIYNCRSLHAHVGMWRKRRKEGATQDFSGGRRGICLYAYSF